MPNYLAPAPLQFHDFLIKIYPEIFTDKDLIQTITFQVTENCCLKCSYCYQTHQANKDMTFETAKIFIDKLLTDQYDLISTKTKKGLIVEFIGGEPFLMIDLVTQISDYLWESMIRLNHPWLLYSRISISSNGMLYFEPKVQNYLNKYGSIISLGISLDGDKELHDACRVDLNGNGSYDRVIAAVRDYKKNTGIMPGIKMTYAPGNINYFYDSMLYLISEGYTDLQGNCVFEEGWELSHATILYNELKKLSDFLLDNDLYNKIRVSLLNEDFYCPMDPEDNENWCGGTGCAMLAIDSCGDCYRCIRYTSSSLQGEQKPLPIGDIYNGIAKLDEHKYNYEQPLNITRRSQSTDECFDCPIAMGCAWCSAYNYQVTGNINKRVTYHCVMHKATSLANVYYWNSLYKKLNLNVIKPRYLPDEECLKIIPLEELNKLKELERR